jgi:hypothetical protein
MPSPAARRISWLIASLLKSKAIPEASLLFPPRTVAHHDIS